MCQNVTNAMSKWTEEDLRSVMEGCSERLAMMSVNNGGTTSTASPTRSNSEAIAEVLKMHLGMEPNPQQQKIKDVIKQAYPKYIAVITRRGATDDHPTKVTCNFTQLVEFKRNDPDYRYDQMTVNKLASPEGPCRIMPAELQSKVVDKFNGCKCNNNHAGKDKLLKKLHFALKQLGLVVLTFTQLLEEFEEDANFPYHLMETNILVHMDGPLHTMPSVDLEHVKDNFNSGGNLAELAPAVLKAMLKFVLMEKGLVINDSV